MRVRARFAAVVLAAVLSTLIAGSAAIHQRAPAVAAATACPSSPVTIGDIIRLYEDPGPLASRFPPAVGWINERASACLGTSSVELRVFVNGTGGIGGASAYSISPRWFLGSGLMVFGTTREVERGVGKGRFYGIAVPPGFGDLQARYHRQWVVITAHFRDDRASRCRATGERGATPTRRQTVLICESVLVLSRIRPASVRDVPDTSTDPAATPGPVLPAGDPPWILLVLAAGVGAWSWPRRRHAASGCRAPG